MDYTTEKIIMKVTEQTLPIVLGFINKILKKHPIINSQLFYPAYKRENSTKRYLNLEADNIEHSYIHSFEVKEALIHRILFNKEPFLNLNNKGDYGVHQDWFHYSQSINVYKATVIKVGQHVTFKNNTLIIKQQHPTNRKMIAIEKIWFTKK